MDTLLEKIRGINCKSKMGCKAKLMEKIMQNTIVCNIRSCETKHLWAKQYIYGCDIRYRVDRDLQLRKASPHDSKLIRVWEMWRSQKKVILHAFVASCYLPHIPEANSIFSQDCSRTDDIKTVNQ